MRGVLGGVALKLICPLAEASSPGVGGSAGGMAAPNFRHNPKNPQVFPTFTR